MELIHGLYLFNDIKKSGCPKCQNTCLSQDGLEPWGFDFEWTMGGLTWEKGKVIWSCRRCGHKRASHPSDYDPELDKRNYPMEAELDERVK